MTSVLVGTTPVLTVEGVTKSFAKGPPWHRRRVEVLRGVALEVRPGELVGLVGENGSGKSTLMQVIVGLLSRDGGTLSAPARLGYCPQQPLLWDKLTVAEHFDCSPRPTGSTSGQQRHHATACSTSSGSRRISATGSRRSRAARGRS